MVLQKMIEEGLLLIQAEPQHDLKLGFRCRLLSAFDEINGPTRSRCGHSKRVKLATLSVEKVLPLWDSLSSIRSKPVSGVRASQKFARGNDLGDSSDT